MAGEDKASAEPAFVLVLKSSKPAQAHKGHVLCSLVLSCHQPGAQLSMSQPERQPWQAEVRVIVIFSYTELQQQGDALPRYHWLEPLRGRRAAALK